jgi:putative heme-binding domain-containing protein
VRDRAAKLFAANLGSRADVVARYQTVCALHGDRQRGREVFLKRCSVCHVLEGKGHAVGADLTTLVNKAPDYLLIAILDPNRAVEDKFVNYIVALDDGRQLSGVLASESGESLTLRAQEGKDQVILRKEVDALKNTGKSYMPEGLEVDMTEQDLADVIAYLGGFGPPPKQFAGNDPRTIKADAKGNFELSATAARIYGRTAAFEPTHQNIGYWGSADDSASWTVDVPAEGKFKVLLDYACANGAAGNTFAIDIAGKTLTGKISGTGTWDNYSEVELATVSLPAGERTINFRSIDLPAGKSLLDLRTIRLKPVN